MQEVRGSSTGREDSSFCKNTVNAGKINNSPRFTQKDVRITR